jgi:hypothetical protein
MREPWAPLLSIGAMILLLVAVWALFWLGNNRNHAPR